MWLSLFVGQYDWSETLENGNYHKKRYKDEPESDLQTGFNLRMRVFWEKTSNIRIFYFDRRLLKWDSLWLYLGSWTICSGWIQGICCTDDFHYPCLGPASLLYWKKRWSYVECNRYYYGVLYSIPNRGTDAVCVTKMEQAIAGNRLLDLCFNCYKDCDKHHTQHIFPDI